MEKVSRVVHVNGDRRTRFWRECLDNKSVPKITERNLADARLLYMLARCIDPQATWGTAQDALDHLWRYSAVREELRDLVQLLGKRDDRLTDSLTGPGLADVPLEIHADYAKDEIMAAFGLTNPGSMREGVKWFEEAKTDVLMVTLRKSPEQYSPTTRYDDRFVAETLFHWESQSQTTEQSPTGQRYRNHKQKGSNVCLFVRETKEVDGRTVPYTCMGLVDFVQSSGEKPMKVLWQLRDPVPAKLYLPLKQAAG